MRNTHVGDLKGHSQSEYGYVSIVVHLPLIAHKRTAMHAALQNKDPFEGIIETDVGDSAPERFYLR